MMQQKKTGPKISYRHIVFLTAFLPRILLAAVSLPMADPAMEMSSFTAAGALAGNDWSAVLENIIPQSKLIMVLVMPFLMFFWEPVRYLLYPLTLLPGQAGLLPDNWIELFERRCLPVQGYGLLLSLLSILTGNPVYLYKVVILVNGLFLSLIAVIVCRMEDRFLPNRSRWLKGALALACSYFTGIGSTLAVSDHLFLLLIWILSEQVLDLFSTDREDRKRWIRKSFLISGLFGMMLWIHGHAPLYLILFILFLAEGRIRTGKWRLYPQSLLLTALMAGVGYLAQNGLVSRILSADSILQLADSSLSGARNLVSTWSLNNLISMLSILTGQICTANVLSGGILITVTVLSICQIRKKAAGTLYPEEISFLFWGICTAAMLFACAVAGIPQDSFYANTNDWNLSNLTGMRNLVFSCAPMFFFGLVCVMREPAQQKSRIRIGVTAAVIVSAVFWLNVIPFLYRTEAGHEARRIYDAFAVADSGKGSIWGFGVAVLFSVLMLLVWTRTKAGRNETVFFTVMAALLVWITVYDGAVHDLALQKTQFDKVDGGYEQLRKADGLSGLTDKVYVLEEEDIARCLEYQYLLKDFKVLPGSSEDEENAVVLTRQMPSQLDMAKWLDRGYLFCEADDNEILMVRGEKLQQKFMDSGIELSDVLFEWTEVKNQMKYSDSMSRLSDGTWQSDGSEGCIAEGPGISFYTGQIEVMFEIEVSSWQEELIAGVDIYSSGDGNVLVSRDLTAADLDEENKAAISLVSPCDTCEGLEFRIFASSGSVLRVRNVWYTRASNEYDVGIERPLELQQLKDMADRFEGTTLNYVIRDEETDRFLHLDNLSSIFSGDTVRIFRNSEALATENRSDYVLMTYDRNLYWDYLPDYRIVGRTSNYVLLASGSIFKPDTGLKIYSEEKRISEDFFHVIWNNETRVDQKSVNLSLGNYNIISRFPAEEGVEDQPGILLVWDSTVGEQQAGYTLKDGYWEAVIPVYNYNAMETVTYGRSLYYDVDSREAPVYVERTNDSVPVDLTNFYMTECAELAEDGSIRSNGKKGILTEGPFFNMSAGEYKLHIRMQVKEMPEKGRIGIRVRSQNGELARKVFSAGELPGKDQYLETELTFTSRDEHNIEIIFDESENVLYTISSIIIYQKN